MIPGPSEIVRIRFWVAVVIRLLNLCLLLTACLPLIAWLIEGIADGDLLNMSYYAERIVLGVVMGVVAVAGWLLSDWLAKVVVRLPPAQPRCPHCGYSIVQFSSGRCSECGLALDAGFASDVVNGLAAPREQAQS